MDVLNWIQKWYLSQCDGEWEHNFGIKIETLDNPGWDVTIDLAETELEQLHMPYNLVELADNDWYGLKIENKVFEGFGDPLKLEFLLLKFKEIAEKNSVDLS